MTIEEMFAKRDLQALMDSSIQKLLENSKLVPSEKLESLPTDIHIKYILSEMERLDTKIIIQLGWAFTKNYFNLMLNTYDYVKEHDDLYALFVFPLMGIIYTKDMETMKYVLATLSEKNKKLIELCDLNLMKLDITGNSVIFTFTSEVMTLYFEEKPISNDKVYTDLEEIRRLEDERTNDNT